MQFIKSIKFNQDIVFDSNREDHKKKFKVKKRTFTELNKRKPIYSTDGQFRQIGYEKRKVVERKFCIFEKALTINFLDLTIIVGDNGSGKSSMLTYLKPPKEQTMFLFSNKTKEEYQKEILSKYLNNDNTSLVFNASPELIILENKIHKNSFINRIGQNKTFVSPQEILAKLDMQNDSNGETTIDFLTSISKIENSLIILDEPETSLSIKSQLKMFTLLKKLSYKNQLIIITHSEIFMNLSRRVYDFETKEYVKTKDYIMSQYGRQ